MCVCVCVGVCVCESTCVWALMYPNFTHCHSNCCYRDGIIIQNNIHVSSYLGRKASFS